MMDAIPPVYLPWLRALGIFLVSLIAARIVDFFLCRVLRKLTARTSTDLDDEIISRLHRPIFVTVVLAGLSLATRQVGMMSMLESVTQSTLVTIGILVWLLAAFPIINLLLQSLAGHPERFSFIEAKTLPLFNNLLKIAVFAVGLYFIIDAWHINPAAWLTSAGIVGLAVGFAAKDTLANLFSGVFILADSPYKVGDFINLESGERGEVTHIGLRSTRIVTRDDIEITLPNAVIGNAKIVNESGGPWPKERLRVAVSVAYGSDIERVREVLLAAAGTVSEVAADPEARVRFRAFGESGLDMELLCWIHEPVHRGRLMDELNTAVYVELNRAGIEIPYPKRDVYIKSMPGAPEG